MKKNFFLHDASLLLFRSHSSSLTIADVPPEKRTSAKAEDNDEGLTNEAQEKHFDNEMEDIDEIEHIKAEMDIPAGAAEMAQQTSVRRKRYAFLSKVP